MRSWEDILESLQGSGAPPVERPLPELEPVLHALGRLGRDANGGILHAERVSWLDENGVHDPEERELFQYLFDQAEAEESLLAAEQREELQASTRRR